MLALEELWEAGYWQAHGVLSQTACDWQRGELTARIGPDRGLGGRELRRELTELLRNPLPDPSPARRRLKEIISHVRVGYLERWAAEVNVPVEERVKPERYSRAVASHLLDLGYSTGHLKAWASDLHRARATTADIAESAADLARTPAGTFEVLVALARVPRRELAEPLENWLGKGKVVGWLREHGHDTSGVRPGGGFVYQVRARDPFGAAEQARQLVERMTARAQFLRRDRGGVEPFPYIWIAGHPQAVPLDPPARGADVLTLVKEGHLYRVTGRRSRIDEALELAAALNRGPVVPAVAGAWAAVESLLSHPDDPKENERSGKAVAADRMAAIIACSWPRAELTALAYRHKPRNPDDLARAVTVCTTNRERAAMVVEALRAKGAEGLDFAGTSTKYSDHPAARRMADLIQNPRAVLNDVASTFRVALRRLYRARNIILHGGAPRGVALEASLRTAAPLVGAGLDRIVHATYAEELAPLDLAARADVALRLVDGETGLSVVDLLEPASTHH
ncbi:integrase [Streptomyces alkaliphilus]|uniref:integrase n=1 Tax=Streptomyces alkaliphilus TaxID=1472722 RepID=UPI001889164A|nr:integrase [Streptomyces alkaliphilus]